MIRWSLGIEISICRKAFIPAWILEETESKSREMLETQGYAQAQDAEEREAQSTRSVPAYPVVLTGLYPGRGEDS